MHSNTHAILAAATPSCASRCNGLTSFPLYDFEEEEVIEAECQCSIKVGLGMNALHVFKAIQSHKDTPIRCQQLD